MFEYLYEWIQNIAFYLVIMTAVLKIIPGKEYKKYVQFFSGLVMILLMLTPVLKLAGIEQTFYELYHSREYEMEKEEIEAHKTYLEETDILDFLPQEYQYNDSSREDPKTDPNKIEVEGIQIGK